MHGGQQLQGFPGRMQGGMHGSGMHSGGASMQGSIPHGGGGMGGWAGVNPAAARAMLLAQQQGQPWGNEQLPLFQNAPGGQLQTPSVAC